MKRNALWKHFIPLSSSHLAELGIEELRLSGLSLKTPVGAFEQHASITAFSLQST